MHAPWGNPLDLRADLAANTTANPQTSPPSGRGKLFRVLRADLSLDAMALIPEDAVPTIGNESGREATIDHENVTNTPRAVSVSILNAHRARRIPNWSGL